MKYPIVALELIAFSSPVFAAPCEKNSTVSGGPMVTAASYKSWQELQKGESTAVLQKLAKAIAAESFSGIQVNKTLFSIDAHQETSGSGRMRIDAVFNKKGQIETP